jgi:hypothetical protein
MDSYVHQLLLHMEKVDCTNFITYSFFSSGPHVKQLALANIICNTKTAKRQLFYMGTNIKGGGREQPGYQVQHNQRVCSINHSGVFFGWVSPHIVYLASRKYFLSKILLLYVYWLVDRCKGFTLPKGKCVMLNIEDDIHILKNCTTVLPGLESLTRGCLRIFCNPCTIKPYISIEILEIQRWLAHCDLELCAG